MTFKNAAGTVVRTVGYQYDPFDRLVWRADDKTTPYTYTDAATERFVHDGDDVVVSLRDPDGNGGQASAIARRYLHGPAVDQVLAEEDGDDPDVLWQAAEHGPPAWPGRTSIAFADGCVDVLTTTARRPGIFSTTRSGLCSTDGRR